MFPDPVLPLSQVVSEFLASLLFKEVDELEKADKLWAWWADESCYVPDDPCIADPPLLSDLEECFVSELFVLVHDLKKEFNIWVIQKVL